MTTENQNEAAAVEQAEEELDKWNNRTRELTVETQEGGSEVVRIRRCGLSNIRKLADADQAGDDALCVKVCMADPEKRDAKDKDFAQWLDGLSEDSQFDLIEKVDEVNGPNLERHQKRMAKRNKAVMDASGVDMDAIVKEIVAAETKKESGGEASPSSEPPAESPDAIPAST